MFPYVHWVCYDMIQSYILPLEGQENKTTRYYFSYRSAFCVCFMPASHSPFPLSVVHDGLPTSKVYKVIFLVHQDAREQREK